MAPRNPATGKVRRQKKRKSRTEVSSDSDSSPEPEQQQSTPEVEGAPQDREERSSPIQKTKQTRDAEITEAFKRYYMQRATTEFEEDLDRVRNAEDFKGDALAILISALQQGTKVFSKEDQQRVVIPTKSTG